jgi:hypothetical protein
LLFVVICQWGVFQLLLDSRCLESSVPVLEGHSNIFDGHGLTSLVHSDEVWPEELVRAWNRLIDPDDDRGRSMNALTNL